MDISILALLLVSPPPELAPFTPRATTSPKSVTAPRQKAGTQEDAEAWSTSTMRFISPGPRQAFHSSANEPEFSTRSFASALREVVDDPHFELQWHLSPRAIFDADPEAGINAPYAWSVMATTDAVVMVLYSGVAIGHPDLAGSVWTNPGEIAGNNVDDDGNGLIDDIHGWDFVGNNGNVTGNAIAATALAASIGAKKNNGLGIAPVAPGVRTVFCNPWIEFEVLPDFTAYADCLKYAVKLKQAGVNITSVLGADPMNTSRWNLDFAKEPIFTALQDMAEHEILFIGPAPLFDLDQPVHWICFIKDGCERLVLDSRATNLVEVTASDVKGSRYRHAGYGSTSIETMAPGMHLFLPSGLGISPVESADALYKAEFIDASEGWTVNEAFEHVAEPGNPANLVLRSTPESRMGASSDVAVIEFSPIDASGYAGEHLTLSFRFQMHDVELYKEDPRHHWYLEFWSPASESWARLGFGLQLLEYPEWQSWAMDLPDGMRIPDLRMRLAFGGLSPASLVLDDFAIGESKGLTYPQYSYFSGTTSAASIIAGMHAVLRTVRPELTMAQTRNLLIASGTQVTEENPHDQATMTGRRANFFKGDGTGLLECRGQKTLSTRLYPRRGYLTVFPGDSHELIIQSNECEHPVQPPPIHVSPGARDIVAHDDGEGKDIFADDGIFSAIYTPTRRGLSNLALPGGEIRTALGVEHYGYVQMPEPIWVEIEESFMSYLDPPFPVHLFGNRVHVDLGITYNPSDVWPKLLKEAEGDVLARTLLSPFFTATRFIGSWHVDQGVVGIAPNRQWVTEWKWDAAKTSPICDMPAGAAVQMVLHESDAAVLMNYRGIPQECWDAYEASIAYQVEFGTIWTVDVPAGTHSFLLYPFFELNIPPVSTVEALELETTEGEPLTLVLKEFFSDEDDDALIFTLTPPVDGLEITPQGELKTESLSAGKYASTLRAFDFAGEFADIPLSLDVNPASSPPSSPPPSNPPPANSAGSGGGGAMGVWLAFMLVGWLGRERLSGGMKLGTDHDYVPLSACFAIHLAIAAEYSSIARLSAAAFSRCRRRSAGSYP